MKWFPLLHLGGDIKYKRDIIVIGTSAGGVEALSNLVSYFPSDLDAAIFIVIHVPIYATSVLPQILNRAGKLPASHPPDREEIRAGHIYIAPPNYHLLIEPGYINLLHGPKENNHRPAIDPLFRSAAEAYGKRVVGVVLTGMLDDGIAGLQAVKMCGGTAIVQSPEDAIYKGMPRSAIHHIKDIDYILPLSEIPQILVELANTSVEGKSNNPVCHQMQTETDLVDMDMATIHNNYKAIRPSTFSCPDCGGILWEIEQKNLLCFQCRIGHFYSLESLLAKYSESSEEALWFALRVLEEKADFSKQIAEKMRDRNQTITAERFEEKTQDTLAHANIIREILLQERLDTQE